MNKVLSTLGRYKKIIFIAGISFVLVSGLLVVGTGFFVYKTAAFVTDKVKTWNTEATLPNVRLPEPGFIEDMVLGVATSWLQQGIVSTEVQSVKNGLACIDALGGPNPVDVVAYVKSRTSDQQVSEQLGNLKERLKFTTSQPTGTDACVSWILNS